jgi:hypothetical protein
MKNPCIKIEVVTTLGTDTRWNRVEMFLLIHRELSITPRRKRLWLSQRVPLPLLEDACDYRVEIKLNMGCILPSGFYGISDYALMFKFMRIQIYCNRENNITWWCEGGRLCSPQI